MAWERADRKWVRISVVIPTLNEAENVPHVFPYLPDFVDEVVVVDGGSTDSTVKNIKKHRPDAKIILETRRGKGQALKTGFQHTTGDVIVIMDADGSHDPKEIRRLLEPTLDGFDAAYGSRMLPGGGSDDITLLRRFGNWIFVTMVNTIYGTDYTDLCYGFRAFKRESLEKMACMTNDFAIETEQSILAKKVGLKVKEVPSFEADRIHGSSRLNTLRDGVKILKIILKEKFNTSPDHITE